MWAVLLKFKIHTNAKYNIPSKVVKLQGVHWLARYPVEWDLFCAYAASFDAYKNSCLCAERISLQPCFSYMLCRLCSNWEHFVYLTTLIPIRATKKNYSFSNTEQSISYYTHVKDFPFKSRAPLDEWKRYNSDQQNG